MCRMDAPIYSPLSPDEIRILTLHPGDQGELSGHLETVKFSADARPDFETLSYVWGEQTHAEPLVLRDAPSEVRDSESSHQGVVTIGPNLALVLRRLRDASEPRRLWCDSVCINQSDLVERASQVQLMGDIYRKARRVIIWLGEESDDSRLALDVFRYTASQFKLSRIKEDLESETITLRVDRDPGFGPSVNEALPFSSTQWRAVANLLARPWFRRLWTRQESVLANDDAIVMVGSQTMLWMHLMGVVTFIDCKRAVDPVFFGSEEAARLFQQNLDTATDLQRMKSDRQCYSMPGYVKSCLCSDDRDRVYATLGMIEPGIAAQIRPDYTLDPKDVYRDMVIAYMGYTRSLYMLDHCWMSKTPSWVPDLEASRPVRQSSAEATSNTEAVVRVIDRDRLEVCAVRCDELADELGTCSIDPTDDDLKALVRDVVVHMLGQDTKQWKPQDLEILSQCLVTGQTFELKEAGFHLPVSHLASVFKQWAKPSTLNDDGEQEIRNFANENTALWNLRRCLHGQSLYRTASGNLVVTPSHAEPKDSIYAIFGCYRTMVLRPIESSIVAKRDEFRVIGPSYHPRLSRSEAICGPLPEGWRGVFASKSWITWRKDGLPDQRRDPRMAGVPLPHGGCEEGEDQYGPFWIWDGDVRTRTRRDPRLRPDELSKRGVKLDTIVLR